MDRVSWSTVAFLLLFLTVLLSTECSDGSLIFRFGENADVKKHLVSGKMEPLASSCETMTGASGSFHLGVCLPAELVAEEKASVLDELKEKVAVVDALGSGDEELDDVSEGNQEATKAAGVAEALEGLEERVDSDDEQAMEIATSEPNEVQEEELEMSVSSEISQEERSCDMDVEDSSDGIALVAEGNLRVDDTEAIETLDNVKTAGRRAASEDERGGGGGGGGRGGSMGGTAAGDTGTGDVQQKGCIRDAARTAIAAGGGKGVEVMVSETTAVRSGGAVDR